MVAALSVMPIVALAPVLYTMYGAGAETARQLVAALAVLIPVYVNTLRGLRQVRPVHRDLMRAYAATARQQQSTSPCRRARRTCSPGSGWRRRWP